MEMIETKTLNMLCHSIKIGHNKVSESDFKITGKGYHHHTPRRKYSKALFIKNNKPSFNEQDKSRPLQLFNFRLITILLHQSE